MGEQIDEHLETFMKCRLYLDGRWGEVPYQLCDLLGYTEQELKAMTFEDVIHPEDKTRTSKHLNKLKSNEFSDFSTDLKFLDSNNDSISVFISGVLVRNREGEPDYILCYIQNLSKQKQILQKLNEREQEFNSLFSNNPHPVYYFDLDGNFDGVNDQLVEFTGKSRRKLLKMGFEDFIVEEDLAWTKEYFQQAISGNSGQYEIKVKVKDGIRDVRVTKFPRYFGDEVVGVFGILQDITKQKLSKRKLDRSEQHFKSLFERNPDAVYSFDTKGNFIEANKALEVLTGYTIEELKELNFEPLVASEDRERVRGNFDKVAVGKAQTYEAAGVHKDGHKFYVQVTNLPIYVDGEIVGVFGIAHDITERKHAEQKLRESEERWQQLVEQNPQPVQIVQDGKIVFINKAGAEYYGASAPEELIGKSILDFTHPEHKEKVLNRLSTLEKNEVVDPHEHKITLLNGDERYIEAHSIPITYKGERAIQTVIHDITDLKEKQKFIGKSLKEKETLLKEIHHRVKNNLAMISSMLELQIMQSSDESAINALRDSQLRIRSIAMIHEKLYQSESLNTINFDIHLKELVQTIQHTYSEAGGNIVVSFDLDSVSLDIQQVIPCSLIVNEVVVNSFKHAFANRTKGNLEISLHNKNSTVDLKIADDGNGLPENFDVYEQQSLGMTLIQALTGQLEGTFNLSNNANGEGTIFRLKFDEAVE